MSSQLVSNPGALKPCPFCGEEPTVHEYETESLFSHAIVPFISISCSECDCAHTSGEQHDEVRAAWNRRSPSEKPMAWVMRDWEAGKIAVSLFQSDRDIWTRRGLEVQPLYPASSDLEKDA